MHQNGRNLPVYLKPHESRRGTRVRSEVEMIRLRYSRPPYKGILCDEASWNWMIILHYSLPERFPERFCDLLILFPATYPEAAPLGFYTNRILLLQNGLPAPHSTSRAYYDAPDLRDSGWHWYCMQIERQSPGGWHPRADFRRPDNLWTFLRLVRVVLSED